MASGPNEASAEPHGQAGPVIINADGSQRRGRTVRARAGLPLGLNPSDLTYFQIDWQTRLQFGETEVVIGCPFVLETDGFVYDLDPETQGDLGPLLDLYPDALADSSVDTEGTLRLNFASGAVIVVPANPQYEAWRVSGPGDHLIVCFPGSRGDLAVWD